MKYIELPPKRSVAFYLAAEEFVAKQYDDDCFFMWQVDPSVIFGHNQLIENEVNIEYCRAHHIQIFRRKSGGGCVYADHNNIMFSYIHSGSQVQFLFDRYTRMIAHLLNQLGVDAQASNRNDIYIHDKKVSGNAFYHLPGRNIVHGTMLFDTNMENMVGSITPSSAKLISKGVASVRQHITLLKDYIQMDIESFKDYIRRNLCNATRVLTPEDIERINETEKEYLSPTFLYGKNPKYSLIRKQRIENCGDFEIKLMLKNHAIKSISMTGDYFVYGDVETDVFKKLEGVNYTKEDICQALEHVKFEDYVLNLTKEKFISLLIDN